jgi:hypothetical protein
MKPYESTQAISPVCPYLGLAGNPGAHREEPHDAHCCYAQAQALALEKTHQRAYCLTAEHPRCTVFSATLPSAETPARKSGMIRRWAPWAAGAVLLAIVSLLYACDLMAVSPPERAMVATTSTQLVIASPMPLALAVEGVGATVLPPSAVAPPAVDPPDTEALQPMGDGVTLEPGSDDVGWWASGERDGQHLGDSFLYAGNYQGRTLLALTRFDLRRVPAGAAIERATLELTGLNADRFKSAHGGVWSVDLLPHDLAPDALQSDFESLYDAADAVRLTPMLASEALQVGGRYTFELDAPQRAWLEQQIRDGAKSVVVRLTGPRSGSESLFAWDSGSGPATQGIHRACRWRWARCRLRHCRRPPANTSLRRSPQPRRTS